MPCRSSTSCRVGAGERIDDLPYEIAELQKLIDTTPAKTLEDAAVKLRRLSAYVDRGLFTDVGGRAIPRAIARILPAAPSIGSADTLPQTPPPGPTQAHTSRRSGCCP
jgi:hypothetical protein